MRKAMIPYEVLGHQALEMGRLLIERDKLKAERKQLWQQCENADEDEGGVYDQCWTPNNRATEDDWCEACKGSYEVSVELRKNGNERGAITRFFRAIAGQGVEK